MTGLRSGIGFLTVLPVGSPGSAGLASARVWFPVVGLLVGLVLAGIDQLMHWGYPVFTENVHYFPTLLAAAILVVTLVVLTRALHLDGFMDCCDGLLGSFDRERRLEIMRDSRVGTFGVTGLVSLLLMKLAALVALSAGGRVWVLLLFPCLSRWVMVMVMQVFPYVRRQGIGTAFLEGNGRIPTVMGLVITVLATLAIAGPFGLALLGGASAVGWLVGAWASKLLGGVTGDVYGAVNELTEASVLALAAVLGHVVSDSLFAPLHQWAW